MIQICLLTYKKLDSMVREAISSFEDEDVSLSVIEGLRNELTDGARKSSIEKADVIIAGGANARIAKEYFDIPVLEYKITDFDYMTAVRQGMRFGEKVAIVTYRSPASKKLLDFFREENRLVNLTYEDTEELYYKIEESQVDVVVGAAHAVEIGEELGKRTILIYPGVDSIRETIGNAKVLAAGLQKERKKNQFMNIMMRYNSDGIIVVDKDDTVLDCNESAVRMFGKKQIKGMELGKISPELSRNIREKVGSQENGWIVKINDHELYQKVTRLEDKNIHYNGAVILLSELSELKEQLQKQEQDRRSRISKGFQAKKNFQDLIGHSEALRTCIEDGKAFSRNDASILLYGETGVGKEVFAQSIHNYSNRRNGNFIAINCAALPENLLESELFGYDEGAFTGGRKGGKKGLFELADKGTIFLDEIGEISPSMQSRLLRVLQEKEIMHVGGDKIIPVDVRVISATNKNFEEMTDAQFRKDLLYRLSVLELNIPPLRERESDVVELFEIFYKEKRNINLIDVELTEEIRKILKLYSWPGNIRELQNVCERFCIYMERGARITDRSLKHCMIKAIGEKRLLQDVFRSHGYDGRDITEGLVLEMKEIFSYNREQIARLLGVSRTTIWRMMKEKN